MRPDPTPSPLEYAQPTTRSGGIPHFRPVALTLGLGGFAANLLFIVLAAWCVIRAREAHDQLLINPGAVGRAFAPQEIEALRHPLRLWAAAVAFGAAALFGLLLAVHLSLSVTGFDDDAPELLQRLAFYVRWKGWGVAATAAALVWLSLEDQAFWEAATPISTGPPLLITALLIGFGVLPLWWVRRRVRG